MEILPLSYSFKLTPITLSTKTITPRIEAATYIRSSIGCNYIRPSNRNGIWLFSCNTINLVIKSLECCIKLQSLMIIRNLIPQLSNDITLSINLILQLTLLQITEFFCHCSSLSCNSTENTIGISLTLCSQCISLLTYCQLICTLNLSHLKLCSSLILSCLKSSSSKVRSSL